MCFVGKFFLYFFRNKVSFFKRYQHAVVTDKTVFTHTELPDHAVCKLHSFSEIARDPGRGFSKLHFFCGVPAKCLHNQGRVVVAVFRVNFLKRLRVHDAESFCSCCNGDLEHVVERIDEITDKRVTGFVISRVSAFPVMDFAFAFYTKVNTLNGGREVSLLNRITLVAGGNQSGFFYDVFNISRAFANGAIGKTPGFNSFIVFDFSKIEIKERFAAFDIGFIDADFSVKTSRTKKRRVKVALGRVGCRNDDNVLAFFAKTVHFDKQLVLGAVCLAPAAECAELSRAADGINFVDENNTGAVAVSKGSGFFKQPAHTRGADTDKHFSKFTSCRRQERNTGFRCNGFCKQGFTAAGRPDKHNALNNLSADLFDTLSVLNQLNHFHGFFFGFLNSDNV